MDLVLTIMKKKTHHILGLVLSRVYSCGFGFNHCGNEDSLYAWSCLELGLNHVDLVLTLVEKKTHHILGFARTLFLGFE